jgi:hypothetical protein
MSETKEKIGDKIDFNQLYRAKGTKGVFTVRSGVNKSGMISICKFLDFSTTRIVRADSLIRLSDYAITTRGENETTYLSLKELFNNIESIFIGEVTNGVVIDDALMSKVAPNYDVDLFKIYHVKQIFEWYNEIFNKIEYVEKEKETTQAL